jgi:hypothetical protein
MNIIANIGPNMRIADMPIKATGIIKKGIMLLSNTFLFLLLSSSINPTPSYIF